MGDDDALETCSEAFTEFMTPTEDGEPLLQASDLQHALRHVGIPATMAPKVLPLMDPGNTGGIGFEQFVTVCGQLLDGGEAGESDPEHDLEDYDDDDDDEDFKDAAVDGAAASRATRRDDDTKLSHHLFDVLSEGNSLITADSLERVGSKINFAVPREDLEKMVQRVSTEEDFSKLWDRLRQR